MISRLKTTDELKRQRHTCYWKMTQNEPSRNQSSVYNGSVVGKRVDMRQWRWSTIDR